VIAANEQKSSIAMFFDEVWQKDVTIGSRNQIFEYCLENTVAMIERIFLPQIENYHLCKNVCNLQKKKFFESLSMSDCYVDCLRNFNLVCMQPVIDHFGEFFTKWDKDQFLKAIAKAQEAGKGKEEQG